MTNLHNNISFYVIFLLRFNMKMSIEYFDGDALIRYPTHIMAQLKKGLLLIRGHDDSPQIVSKTIYIFFHVYGWGWETINKLSWM
jgi:hypothetical protein